MKKRVPALVEKKLAFFEREKLHLSRIGKSRLSRLRGKTPKNQIQETLNTLKRIVELDKKFLEKHDISTSPELYPLDWAFIEKGKKFIYHYGKQAPEKARQYLGLLIEFQKNCLLIKKIIEKKHFVLGGLTLEEIAVKTARKGYRGEQIKRILLQSKTREEVLKAFGVQDPWCEQGPHG
ncbi:MAG: hypothetical protein AB1467_05395 [Candidatus Diapherotrites archaeon]